MANEIYTAYLAGYIKERFDINCRVALLMVLDNSNPKSVIGSRAIF